METVLHYIKKYAETQPDTLAVCELKKHLTYAEYWKAIRKIANVLLQNGIKKDAHVILRCTQNVEYMVLFSALQYMQALVIPVERSTSPERMQEIRDKVDAEWLISNKESEGLPLVIPEEAGGTDGEYRRTGRSASKCRFTFDAVVHNGYDRQFKGCCHAS